MSAGPVYPFAPSLRWAFGNLGPFFSDLYEAGEDVRVREFWIWDVCPITAKAQKAQAANRRAYRRANA